MKRMSFALTAPQFRARTKTVTRRLRWQHLQPGDRLLGVVKCMGLKRGEKQEPLGVIEVVAVDWVQLRDMTPRECELEGFPEMTPAEFVDMFCDANGCAPHTVVRRIEFRYVD